MKNTKSIIKIMIISILSIILFATQVNAVAVQVTDENLEEAFQKYVESELNEDNAKINVEENIIKIEVEGNECEIKYDLSQNPTFTIEVNIQNGMTYDEYQIETKKLEKIYIPYLAVANIHGVDLEAAKMYYMLSYAENFNGSYSSEDGVIIIDDTSASEGVTIVKNDDPKTFYVSEFPDRVMDYTNYMYKERNVISDSKNIDSFEIINQKKDVTETSCKLVSTITINNNADFSKITGFTGGIEDSFMDNGITKDNADYVIELKVGQKCKIETSEEFRGYELYSSCVEIDKEVPEITAIKEGNANGYFYIGDAKKSFYITVEENTTNDPLETIVLTIGKKEETKPSTDNEKNEFVVTVPNDTKEKDETVVNTNEIPKAGIKSSILYIFILFVILATVIGKKVNKYKEI